MAAKKISDLTAAGTLTAADLFEIEQPGETAGTRSRKLTLALLLARLLQYDNTTSGLIADTLQGAVDELASLVTGSAETKPVGVQFVADTGSTADSDPGAGLLKWNNTTQASANELYLDDDTADGVTLTALWAALDAGGLMYLQDAVDQDTWQIWEITGVNDAAGYVKLAVGLLAQGGSFADGADMLVTIEQGAVGGGGSGDVVGPGSAGADGIAVFDGTTGKLLKDGGQTIADVLAAALAAAGAAIRPAVIQAVTSASTVTPAYGQDEVVITAQAAALTLANWSGSPTQGWGIVLRIKDNGTARAISYGTNYRAADGVTLPTTTVIGKTHYLCCIHNSTDGKHDVLSVGTMP